MHFVSRRWRANWHRCCGARVALLVAELSLEGVLGEVGLQTCDELRTCGETAGSEIRKRTTRSHHHKRCQYL